MLLRGCVGGAHSGNPAQPLTNPVRLFRIPAAPNTSWANRVLTQQQPRVCGSCWAEAVLGALSDRFAIATGGALQMQLAPQVLLNFVMQLTGGSCMGGNSLDAYNFTHRYGVTDDTCAPFAGTDFTWGFTYAAETNVTVAAAHMCQVCGWDGNCDWAPASSYDVYHSDEFGVVGGAGVGDSANYSAASKAMMAEIYARGPIACHLNSDPPSFDLYTGGVITEPAGVGQNHTDHVIVIAGWGVDSTTGTEYWVGRNSYGGRWGEGAGGGWFRLARGVNALAIETYPCSWAVPAAADVERAMKQSSASVAVPVQAAW